MPELRNPLYEGAYIRMKGSQKSDFKLLQSDLSRDDGRLLPVIYRLSYTEFTLQKSDS